MFLFFGRYARWLVVGALLEVKGRVEAEEDFIGVFIGFVSFFFLGFFFNVSID